MIPISKDDVQSLSPAQRVELMSMLWDSLLDDKEALPGLSDEQIAEIDRREANFRAQPARPMANWPEFRERLKQRRTSSGD